MCGVRVVFSKWGGRAHWEYDAVLLGRDEHGTWLGAGAGTRCTRPGVEFCAEQAFVVLVPDDRAFVATFYGSGGAPPQGMIDIYVDITTVPVIGSDAVRMVDLDLDVIRGRTGRAWVDDEDEFADHRVRFGYPDEVVALATRTCTEVLADVESRTPPYDGVVSERWLAALDAAVLDRR
jgi:uncharacterized protein